MPISPEDLDEATTACEKEDKEKTRIKKDIDENKEENDNGLGEEDTERGVTTEEEDTNLKRKDIQEQGMNDAAIKDQDELE